MPIAMGTDYSNAMFAGDSDTWGGPLNGVDLTAQAGFEVGPNKWHSRMTIDLWSMVVIFGALALLWILGGIVFRRVNVI